MDLRRLTPELPDHPGIGNWLDMALDLARASRG
jgi:hypothetical protein